MPNNINRGIPNAAINLLRVIKNNAGMQVISKFMTSHGKLPIVISTALPNASLMENPFQEIKINPNDPIPAHSKNNIAEIP